MEKNINLNVDFYIFSLFFFFVEEKNPMFFSLLSHFKVFLLLSYFPTFPFTPWPTLTPLLCRFAENIKVPCFGTP